MLRVTTLLLLSLADAMAFLTKPPKNYPRTGELSSSRVPVQSRVSSPELLDLFNRQVTNELQASQLYLSASIWCDVNDLVGMASFMRRESEEERGHGLAFIDFANKRNIPLRLEALEPPPFNWNSVEELWEDVLVSEIRNTQCLLALGDAAAACSDHAVSTFLMPYHMEQVDSEDTLQTILAKVKDESQTPGLLRQLDYELGSGDKQKTV